MKQTRRERVRAKSAPPKPQSSPSKEFIIEDHSPRTKKKFWTEERFILYASLLTIVFVSLVAVKSC